MFGRITRNTNIGRDQVVIGDVVEVDDSTFGQLKRANAIEKCDPPEGTEPKKQEPKFKKLSAKKSTE
jgi:hypothetical protein